ncbi:hypothetical protein [Klenkia terrae]|uniref:Uncharacterized protein n=2 Tax=Geodermatophilales TaxID=1643682 RepID=A0ABU8E820_9ACTN|nr:hypothetical protein [Klenkia terrae]
MASPKKTPRMPVLELRQSWDVLFDRAETAGGVLTTTIASTGIRLTKTWQVALLSRSDSLGGAALVRRRQRSGDFDLLVEVLHPRRITPPVPWTEVLEGLPEGRRSTVTSALAWDSLLPPGAADVVVARLDELRAGVAEAVQSLRDRLQAVPGQISAAVRNRREQRDAVALGFELAGVDSRARVPDVESAIDVPFLRGLTTSTTQEAALIRHDAQRFGLWVDTEVGIHDVWRYTDPDVPQRRLTVLYADKTELELLTGTDLIYYREETKAFVLVQYKRMTAEANGSRVSYRPDAQLTEELKRMASLGLVDSTPVQVEDMRLSAAPFYVKLVNPDIRRPDGNRLAKGMYFPVDLFELVRRDRRVEGSRGGVAIGWHNAMRYLTNGQFVDLVGGSWIGTRGDTSTVVSSLIRNTLENNRGIVVVIDESEHSQIPSRRP